MIGSTKTLAKRGDFCDNPEAYQRREISALKGVQGLNGLNLTH